MLAYSSHSINHNICIFNTSLERCCYGVIVCVHKLQQFFKNTEITFNRISAFNYMIFFQAKIIANAGIKILVPGLPGILLIIYIPTAIAEMIDFLFLTCCTANIVVNRHITEHRAIVCFDVHFVTGSCAFLSSCIFLLYK